MVRLEGHSRGGHSTGRGVQPVAAVKLHATVAPEASPAPQLPGVGATTAAQPSAHAAAAPASNVHATVALETSPAPQLPDAGEPTAAQASTHVGVTGSPPESPSYVQPLAAVHVPCALETSTPGQSNAAVCVQAAVTFSRPQSQAICSSDLLK